MTNTTLATLTETQIRALEPAALELAARWRLERWRDEAPPRTRWVYSHGGDVHAVALDRPQAMHLTAPTHRELAQAMGLSISTKRA